MIISVRSRIPSSLFFILLAGGCASSGGLGCASSGGAFSENIEGRLEEGDAILDHGERYDAFEFDALSGQRLVAECESADFDPVLHLLDSDDRPIAYNDDLRFGVTTAGLSEKIEKTGKYRIVVRAHEPPGEGAYRLRVELRGEP